MLANLSHDLADVNLGGRILPSFVQADHGQVKEGVLSQRGSRSCTREPKARRATGKK